MRTHFKALHAGLLLAALIPFAAVRADDTAKPRDVTPTPETPLHEIGAAPAPAAAAVAPTAEPTPAPSEHYRHHHDDDGNRVRINGSTYVGPKESIDDNAVAVNGDLTVDGNVNGNGVAVLGSALINGNVDGNSVAVLGPSTINGTVHGNAVAVMGNLTLGPNARVDGNAVSVGGNVIKDPTATVGGQIVPIYFGVNPNSPEATSIWRHSILRGRPLAFGSHFGIYWILNLCIVAIYVLLALIFPNGVTKCADTLQHRPGITFLTGFLAMLGIPVLFILLCVTVIGIPVALIILPLGIGACVLFGKTAVYALIGRSVLNRKVQPVAALLVGVVIVLVLFAIPLLGLMLWILIAFLGFSCALATLFSKAPAPAGIPPAAAQPAMAPVIAPSLVAAVSAADPAAEAIVAPAVPLAAAVPPMVASPAAPLHPALSPASEAALPRAGFWIRMVALMIDVVLVGIVTHMSDWFLPVLALYGAALWQLRGATVGGIIFGLKVVRIDGRPSDWVTMIVRALGCFFSLIVVGLGFLWIAFDPQKQAWHDKIAGTVVVRVPKGVSLV
ncbi:MAG TPA: RDD family protein [Opitutaceae bacterium]